MSCRFASILSSLIQGKPLCKHGTRCFPPHFPPHPNRTGSLQVPSRQLLHQGHRSGRAGISSLCICRGNFLLLQFCVGSSISSCLFLVLALYVYSCCMRSFGWLRTIALDVTRLATSVEDGPCSSRGNAWHCSDFSQLMLAGLGATHSLVCRQLHLQYQWALARRVSRLQA